MELVFQKQDLISYFHPRKKVNRLRFGVEYHTLLVIEPFQLWLSLYVFNFGKIDGGIFYDESFMMEVPAGSPLKTDNVIKRMDRTPFIFSSKINLFITYTDYFLQKSHVNSMATDVAFRESLLKLKMYL